MPSLANKRITVIAPLAAKRYGPADGQFGPFRRLGNIDDHDKWQAAYENFLY